jgi:UPF0271 protein
VAPPSSVDLNADVGEATDEDDVATERALLRLMTSVNIACGGHASDEQSMRETVRAALDAGVEVGAHPSYPDRAGFGRRRLTLPAAQLEASLRAQLRRLAAVCASCGTTMTTVKPHGALYAEVATGGVALETLRAAMADTCAPGTALVLPFGSPAVAACRAAGDVVRAEGFCDRAYASDGSLLDRSVEGAVLRDPQQAARQAVALAEGDAVDTLCIHGDSPGAVALALAVRAALAEAGFVLARAQPA